MRRQINSKILIIENLINKKDDKKAIQQAKEDLISTVEPMILEKVNRSLSAQVIGKKIDNF